MMDRMNIFDHKFADKLCRRNSLQIFINTAKPNERNNEIKTSSLVDAGERERLVSCQYWIFYCKGE